MAQLTILGSGAWGTALASVLENQFDKTVIWSYIEQEADEINAKHASSRYLPHVVLKHVRAVTSLKNALTGADIIISAVPSFAIRMTWEQAKQFLSPKIPFINASKGVEKDSHKLPYELYEEIFQTKDNYFSLAGPSFAEDVAEKKPTAVNLAGKDKECARSIIKKLQNKTFHLRYSDDVVGTELGAVMKNVIAIASGMVMGNNFGPNTQAIVVVEGIKEMMALGKEMGAKEETFLGLSGLGDLLLTAMNNKSRNMNFGIELGKGLPLDEALLDQKGVAEGYYTTFSVDYMLQKYKVSLPLCSMIVDILIHKRPIHERFTQFLGEVF